MGQIVLCEDVVDSQRSYDVVASQLGVPVHDLSVEQDQKVPSGSFHGGPDEDLPVPRGSFHGGSDEDLLVPRGSFHSS